MGSGDPEAQLVALGVGDQDEGTHAGADRCLLLHQSAAQRDRLLDGLVKVRT